MSLFPHITHTPHYVDVKVCWWEQCSFFKENSLSALNFISGADYDESSNDYSSSIMPLSHKIFIISILSHLTSLYYKTKIIAVICNRDFIAARMMRNAEHVDLREHKNKSSHLLYC